MTDVRRDRSLAGRVALVTGGASGIGAATASTLAYRGATVIVSDRDLAEATRLAGVVGGSAVELDVRSDESWRAMLARTDLPAPITLAYLNAGKMTRREYPYAIEDVSADEVAEVFDVNVVGVVNGLRHLVPVLETAGGGAITISSSLAGVAPFDIDPLYAATKHALIGLATSIAESLAARGVDVNVVCPGATDTALISDGQREIAASRGLPLMPPERVAGVVASLLTCAQHGEIWAVTADRGVFRMDKPRPLGRPVGG